MAGCEGDDGAQGPAGPQGPIGATGPAGADGADGAGASVLPLESCGVCHSDGSFASAPAAHAVTGVPTISNVEFFDNLGDLEISYNLLIDGEAVDNFTTVTSAYVYTAADGAQNGIVNPITVVSDGGGDFTATIENGTALAGAAARFFLRVGDGEGTRAVVSGDYPDVALPAIAADASCTNCHGPKGLAVHAAFGYPGMEASECVTCHKAEVDGLGFLDFADSWVGLIHGIHNAHSFPDGFYDYDGTVFDTTYPTYMTNCSVCHSEAPQLAAANAMPVTGAGCLSCHGSMEYAGWDFTGGLEFHLTNIADPLTHDCASQCHEPGGAAQSLVDVTDFHNGWVTGNDGVIFDGVDTSVAEGAKFDWAITSMLDDGVNLTFTWEASYDGVGVDPCNETVGAGAPTFHLGDGGLRTYRSYAQGDDFIIGTSTSAPGQPSRANLDAANTSCVGGIATTVIPVEAVAAEKGRIALGGKPLVISADVPDLVVEARVPSPTFDWLVGIGGPAPDRRAVVDNELCLSCHVGSLYQHGGDRVDNVDYCLICHNSASNEQNVRVGMGVDAAEAYDGRVGETYELKTMLHRIHSAGAEGQPTYLVYRNRGIYAFGPDESVIPNWPGTGQQVVFGSDPEFTTNHNFHAPTYPRLLNDCTACHDADFAVIPEQASAMATTVEAGSDMWEDQLDDVLQGPGTTACVTCHAGSASKGHAYQNSWVPQEFPEGRDTIIDAGN
jgi:OmcA/MtrC family decaheme c-type cytochrome